MSSYKDKGDEFERTIGMLHFIIVNDGNNNGHHIGRIRIYGTGKENFLSSIRTKF